MDRKKVAPFFFNFILWTSVFFCQLEAAFRVRMSRVGSASSSVFACFFVCRPPVKESSDDTGKRLVPASPTRELEEVCVVRMLLVSDIYLILPAHQQHFKDASGSFRPS